MKFLRRKTALILGSLYLLTACSDASMRFMYEPQFLGKADTPSDGWIPVVDPTPLPEPIPEPTPAPTPVVVVPTPAPTPVVVIPPPVPTPQPTPVVVVPTPTPVVKDDCQEAGLSQKTCYLMKIMALGCPLRDYVPANYVPPTQAQVIANMDQCSEASYPYTEPTSDQVKVIQSLINPDDEAFRKYIFTGLYYKPPFTDDFKKYFGIEIYTAIYTFCYNDGLPTGPGSILPREAYGNENYVMDKEYRAANVYAGQLNQCVRASKRTP